MAGGIYLVSTVLKARAVNYVFRSRGANLVANLVVPASKLGITRQWAMETHSDSGRSTLLHMKHMALRSGETKEFWKDPYSTLINCTGIGAGAVFLCSGIYLALKFLNSDLLSDDEAKIVANAVSFWGVSATLNHFWAEIGRGEMMNSNGRATKLKSLLTANLVYIPTLVFLAGFELNNGFEGGIFRSSLASIFVSLAAYNPIRRYFDVKAAIKEGKLIEPEAYKTELEKFNFALI